MPRGREYLKLRPITSTPFANKADATVSPSNPWYSLPLKVKFNVRVRLMRLLLAAIRLIWLIISPLY